MGIAHSQMLQLLLNPFSTGSGVECDISLRMACDAVPNTSQKPVTSV